ncbi:MAG: choice-of-anchor Q domain-containing protein [Planctomycetota bacterium]|jgi:hypothetical protein
MKHKRITICFCAVLIANSALATTYYVPEEYVTIQSAIDVCQDFDTVVIAAGRYFGSGNYSINFNGKAITIRSTDPTDPQIVNSTVIDCNSKGRGFAFNTEEDADSKVMGLTITNGYGIFGGAIYSYNNSSPSITNCVIRNNSAVYGGGIACTNGESYPVITNCQIIANSAIVFGGGIYLNGSSPTIKNCIISENVALDGGAIYSHFPGNPAIVNCTISGNVASNSAGAVYCYNASNLSISHSILWGDTAPDASEIMVGNQGDPTSIQISYCDIQGGEPNVILADGCTVDWGQGNIDLDPCFVNPDSNDYHLLPDSPCIDAGDPEFVAGPDETDIDGNPRILGEKIDIGADESVPPIPATVKITPKTLNLQRRNVNWISCTIELPGDYDIADVNSTSIALSKGIGPNEKIRPAGSSTERANKLLVKFDRSEIQKILNDAESPVSLRITGKLNDGSYFAGTDTIRIVRSGGKK